MITQDKKLDPSRRQKEADIRGNPDPPGASNRGAPALTVHGSWLSFKPDARWQSYTKL